MKNKIKKLVAIAACVAITSAVLPGCQNINDPGSSHGGAATGNVSVDLTGKKNGRGAYLKRDIEVVEMAQKTKQLEKFLEVNVPDEVYEELKRNINN